MELPRVTEVAVIGGGINGLAAAWHLALLGGSRVTLIERATVGHQGGGSHGPTRITRSTYAAADYIRLMRHVHAEEWPRLAKALGQPLILPTPGCFFGPPEGSFDGYARAIDEALAADSGLGEASGVSRRAGGVSPPSHSPGPSPLPDSMAGLPFGVTRMSAAEARRRLPTMTFADSPEVLFDTTGGVLLAERAVRGLDRLIREAGVTVLEGTTVTGIEPTPGHVRLRLESSGEGTTSRSTLEAGRVIVTVGSWVNRLLPDLAVRVQPARQTVGYFPMPGDPDAWRPGRFPCWVYLGRPDEGLYYGLPQLGDEGIKFARHLTSDREDDPDHAPAAPDLAEVARLHRFADRHFPVTAAARIAAGKPRFDWCLYANAPNEDFLLDAWPVDARVLIGSACSGHGFKFGPLTGRALAERTLLGRCQVPLFEEVAGRFRLPLAGTGSG